jgi:hypothetical protein
VGTVGAALITAFPEATEGQPATVCTVKVYVVPAAKPLIVPVVPVPVAVTPPGAAVTVHVPLEGKPLKATLPVVTEHVGCVIVPTTGAVGATQATFVQT